MTLVKRTIDVTCFTWISVHAGKAFLVYWKEEDSVSLARLEDMVEQNSEPKVGDKVKVKFQRLVCQGQVAEGSWSDNDLSTPPPIAPPLPPPMPPLLNNSPSYSPTNTLSVDASKGTASMEMSSENSNIATAHLQQRD